VATHQLQVERRTGQGKFAGRFTTVSSHQPVKEGQRYINLNPGKESTGQALLNYYASA